MVLKVNPISLCKLNAQNYKTKRWLCKNIDRERDGVEIQLTR
jgi:hypothetical protein